MSRRVVLRVICILGLMTATLFVSAGRIDLIFFWLFLGVEAVGWTMMLVNLDPHLLHERIRPGAGGLDRNLRGVMTVLFGVCLAIAGLDAGRFGWSNVPEAAQAAAMICLAAAFALTAWAQRVNRFFSPVVRIQDERGHQVITGGPYRLVRHPGYLGVASMVLLCGPSLGSWWSLGPGAIAVALLLRRTIIEDRFLRGNLPGYENYANRVRYRVLPGIW